MQYGDQAGGVNWKAPAVPGVNVSGPGAVGGGPAAGGPAPAAPPKNLASIIPGSANYLRALVIAHNAHKDATDQISYNRGQTYQQYGYLTSPNGGIGGVDPHNPYGLYQQEHANEAMLTMQGLNAQRAGGWGKTGSVAEALQRAKQGISQGAYNQGQSLNALLTGYTQQEAAATKAEGDAGDTAYQTAWQNAVNSGAYDPVTGQPIPTDAPPATTTQPTTTSAAAGRTATPVTHPTKAATIKKILPKKKKIVAKPSGGKKAT